MSTIYGLWNDKFNHMFTNHLIEWENVEFGDIHTKFLTIWGTNLKQTKNNIKTQANKPNEKNTNTPTQTPHLKLKNDGAIKTQSYHCGFSGGEGKHSIIGGKSKVSFACVLFCRIFKERMRPYFHTDIHMKLT